MPTPRPGCAGCKHASLPAAAAAAAAAAEPPGCGHRPLRMCRLAMPMPPPPHTLLPHAVPTRCCRSLLSLPVPVSLAQGAVRQRGVHRRAQQLLGVQHGGPSPLPAPLPRCLAAAAALLLLPCCHPAAALLLAPTRSLLVLGCRSGAVQAQPLLVSRLCMCPLPSWPLCLQVMAHLQLEGYQPGLANPSHEAAAQQQQRGRGGRAGRAPPPPLPADLQETLGFLHQLAAGALPAMSQAGGAQQQGEGKAPSADLGTLLWGFFDRFGALPSFTFSACLPCLAQASPASAPALLLFCRAAHQLPPAPAHCPHPPPTPPLPPPAPRRQPLFLRQAGGEHPHGRRVPEAAAVEEPAAAVGPGGGRPSGDGQGHRRRLHSHPGCAAPVGVGGGARPLEAGGRGG
jgi:hypothetical protein